MTPSAKWGSRAGTAIGGIAAVGALIGVRYGSQEMNAWGRDCPAPSHTPARLGLVAVITAGALAFGLSVRQRHQHNGDLSLGAFLGVIAIGLALLAFFFLSTSACGGGG